MRALGRLSSRRVRGSSNDGSAWGVISTGRAQSRQAHSPPDDTTWPPQSGRWHFVKLCRVGTFIAILLDSPPEAAGCTEHQADDQHHRGCDQERLRDPDAESSQEQDHQEQDEKQRKHDILHELVLREGSLPFSALT